jgi:uncharacterized protein (TIGR03032 family)
MESDAPEPTEFSITVSRHFAAWLAEQKTSLAFTIPPAKLFLIGLKPDGELSIFERSFSKTMGLAPSGANTLYLGTLYQLWRLESPLKPGQFYEDEYDRLYIPRRMYVTGQMNVHDVAVDRAGRPIFVNTRFGCLATVSDEFSFVPVWRPPFLPELTPGDKCHLNGLAMRDGRLAYATSVSQTAAINSWRDHRRDGGCVIDIAANEIVTTGLSMPHSPRWYRNTLWLTNAGTGELGCANLGTGRFEPLTFAPGFTRGLCFVGDYAVVGSSKPRHGNLYSGLALDDELARRKLSAKLGLFVVDLRSGEITDWLLIDAPDMRELFDVVALPGVRQPMALGIIAQDIQTNLWFPTEPAGL